MARRSSLVHLLGCIATLAVALALLGTVFPMLVSEYFPRPSHVVGLRGEAIDYLFVSLIPVLVWLAPPLVRALARVTHHTHKLLLGKSGFYVRFPTPRNVRFRDTVVRSLGPFSIDLVVIAEIEYFLGGAEASLLIRSLFAIPFLFLAGIVTSLLPGPWLVDALDLRLVNPKKGEVVREAAIFEGLLGPIGAVALLVSFVTLVHTLGDSYALGLVVLGLWGARVFPPILAAVSVYRIFVEPDVLPSLEAWTAKEGIEVKSSLADTLATLRSAPPPPPRESLPAPSGAPEAKDPHA